MQTGVNPSLVFSTSLMKLFEGLISKGTLNNHSFTLPSVETLGCLFLLPIFNFWRSNTFPLSQRLSGMVEVERGWINGINWVD